MGPLGSIPVKEGHSGADVGPMKAAGVMLMGLATEGSSVPVGGFHPYSRPV